MNYNLHMVRALPDGGESKARFAGEAKLAALLTFERWALPRMDDDANLPVGEETLWEAPLQCDLERPLLMLELSYQADGVPFGAILAPLPHWVVIPAGQGWQNTRQDTFPDDQAGRRGTLRLITTLHLSDKGPAWGV